MDVPVFTAQAQTQPGGLIGFVTHLKPGLEAGLVVAPGGDAVLRCAQPAT